VKLKRNRTKIRAGAIRKGCTGSKAKPNAYIEGGQKKKVMTVNDILNELHNPARKVVVEWNFPETVPGEERERIKNEVEAYRMQATAEEVEEFIEMVEIHDTPLQAASMFLDLAADHGVYNTITVSLNTK
jgi:sulfur carrier protein ThiS